MIVGTAGHIDHGKTALVGALTGVDTDRLKEEKARGITIDLGFAYLPAPSGAVIGFVDVPGHERLVHTMLAGAGGIDVALVVVAADDGVMPQTREHLAILDLLGIHRGVVALSKADLASPARLAVVADEIRGALAGTGLADAEILPVSARSGSGIEGLRERLFAAADAIGRRGADGRFRLSVDRSFTLAGAGTVVTGTVVSGVVAVGDRVVVSPAGLPARVRSIRAQDRDAPFGRAGDRCGLNLAGDGVSKEAISRGDVVCDPGLHAPATHIDAQLNVLAGEPKPIGQWFPVRLHHAAAEVGARVVLLDDAPVVPGSRAVVQLVLERPIAATAGDRFVVRDTSARRTIGGGTFLDLRAPTRKRRSPMRRAQLAAHALADPDEAVARLLEAPPHVLDLTSFCRDRALAGGEAERIATRLRLVRLSVGDAAIVLSPERWQAFRACLLSALAAFHADNPDLPGIGRERLRLALEPRLTAPVFLVALARLAEAGEVGLAGAFVRLAGHEVRFGADDEPLWAAIAPAIGGGERFRPPRVRDLAGSLAEAEGSVRRLLKTAGRMGLVDEVAHDHFFLRETTAEMVGIAADLGAEEPFTAAQFRDRVDSGRKVAIQILEFFDRHGVTLRRGDLRRINRHRLDLFGPVPAPPAPAPDPLAATAGDGGEASPVGRPDFKSGRGREPVSGGFDPHSPPPSLFGLRR